MQHFEERKKGELQVAKARRASGGLAGGIIAIAHPAAPFWPIRARSLLPKPNTGSLFSEGSSSGQVRVGVEAQQTCKTTSNLEA